MKRRSLLKGIGLAALAGSIPGQTFSSVTEKLKTSKIALRIAHITDMHIQPELEAQKGVIKCLHHLQSLAEKPDIIFTGGDTIMDALVKDKARVQLQWDLWHSTIKSDCELPIEYCIGNHDVWGFEEAKNEPLYGKKYALDMMNLKKPFRSFDKNGWHFIVLDSTQLTPDGKWYTAFLDMEQKEWLKADLAATPKEKPIFIISHIPILSATPFYFGNNVKDGQWQVPGSWMHIDSAEITTLFIQYPNVKICVSGHMHLLDRVDYNNVSYFCNGAVSGNWWKGDYHQTKPGYSVIDLYDDGTFVNRYIPYN